MECSFSLRPKRSKARNDALRGCEFFWKNTVLRNVSGQRFTKSQVEEVAGRFALEGSFVSAEEIETGLINSTWVMTYETQSNQQQSRYILQCINESVFGNPREVMSNVEKVTSHIRRKADQEQDGQVLRLYPSCEGKSFVDNGEGGLWRCYNFIEGCRSHDLVETAHQAYQAGRAFGSFLELVSDLDAEGLVEVIPDFHNTRQRYQQLQAAVAADALGRVSEVAAELALIESMAAVSLDRIEAMEEGSEELPLRVTHNDTKINNVLFDVASDEAVCVIDLDTVMPGLSLYDFGDLIRTATNPANEDERDLSKVQMRMPIFEALTEGYLQEAGAALTAREISLLPFSGKLIALELGMRFLSDYLSGDHYFRTTREGQNLDRARTQLRLASLIDEAEPQMNAFVSQVMQQR